MQHLPFRAFWTKTELYLTISATRLRVFRIALPDLNDLIGPRRDGPVSTTIQPLVPTETIFLPRSARLRSVQFIPSEVEGGTSTVIIGPRYGGRPQAPIAISLSPTDLGPWVNIVDKEIDVRTQKPGVLYLKGRYEEFKVKEFDAVTFQ